MKRLVLIVALVSSVSSYASDWFDLISNSSGTTSWQGLKGSYERRTNKLGDDIVVWTEKENNLKNSQITVQKLYVKTADCLQKQGKAVVVNMDGDFRYDFDFIFGAGSVGSYRAEALCKLYLGKLAEIMGKGL